MSFPPSEISDLESYTACDISDALLKLKVPYAGFLTDLKPYTSLPSKPLIGPAYTVLFVPKTAETSSLVSSNIPKDSHWVDLTPPHHIVVISQPPGQRNACLGGIMALRMAKLEAVGVVVDGRIRDIHELEATKLPIWAKGTSTVGAGAESKAHAVNVPIIIEGVEISPADLLFCDDNGVVVIPKAQASAVVDLLPRIVGADDKVKKDMERGVSVKEVFEKHRSNL